MTGAEEAAAKLRECVTTDLAGFAQTADGMAFRARESDDLLIILHHVGGFVIAAEATEAAAKSAAERARAVLAEVMLSTGATTIRTAHHTVSVSEGRRGVTITGQVPATYLRPGTPDRERIRRELEAGATLDFATLSNGGAPYISIHARKQL